MDSTTNGPKRSFYYPHRRSATWFTGEIVDPKTGELYTPPSRTKQSFVAECDINNILKQYKLTGQIRHMSARAAQGAYQDLPDPVDFQDAMNLVLAAESSFATLPAHVRARFGHDPAEFLGFIANPANQDEVIKMGLAKDTRPPAAPADGSGSSPRSEAASSASPPAPTPSPPKA